MIVSKKSVDLIVFEEVSSKELYTKRYTGLVVPPGNSGVTIGIGYDLAHHTATDIERDWKGLIHPEMIEILKMFIKIKGDAARAAIKSNVLSKRINIPFDAGFSVFIKTSLPKYARQTLSIYPNADKLLPDAAGALVSLVYNRGTDLTGDRRKEMKAIQPLVNTKDYDGIANQFLSMKRLWNNGLVQRREREAALVKNAVRQYTQSDLVEI